MKKTIWGVRHFGGAPLALLVLVMLPVSGLQAKDTVPAGDARAQWICNLTRSGNLGFDHGADGSFPVEIETVGGGGKATFFLFGDSESGKSSSTRDMILWTDKTGANACSNDTADTAQSPYAGGYPIRGTADQYKKITYQAGAARNDLPCASITVLTADGTAVLKDEALDGPLGGFEYHNDIYMFYLTTTDDPLLQGYSNSQVFLARYMGVNAVAVDENPACDADGGYQQAKFKVIGPAFRKYTTLKFPWWTVTPPGLFNNLAVVHGKADDAYLYVIGKPGWSSYAPVYVQRVKKSDIDKQENATNPQPWSEYVEYWSGPDLVADEPKPNWKKGIVNAAPLPVMPGGQVFETQDITMMSVQWNSKINQWIMTYNASGAPTGERSDFDKVFCNNLDMRWLMPILGIACPTTTDPNEKAVDFHGQYKAYYRLASSLTGPWTDPQPFTWTMDGTNYYMTPQCVGGTNKPVWVYDGDDVGVNGCVNPSPGNHGVGILHGFELMPESHSLPVDGSGVFTHYATISSWSPYQRNLLELKMNVDPDHDGVFGALDGYPNIEITGCLDVDRDGVPEEQMDGCDNRLAIDNCPDDHNPDQLNFDGDPDGDSCDPDDDGDSVPDVSDNCPYVYNSNQLDVPDGDGHGNECDAFDDDPSEWSDRDVDGFGDNSDDFPFVFNASLAESLDSDGDLVSDSQDAYPLNFSEQWDTDGDDIGNNADPDDDGDGYLDCSDDFPWDDTEWSNPDGDSLGNNADPDDDNDRIPDSDDKCPLHGGASQSDRDLDGFGDDCDPFWEDAAEWLDTDGDRIGNNADTDDDNDDLSDVEEVTAHTDPLNSNTDCDCYIDGADPAPLLPGTTIAGDLDWCFGDGAVTTAIGVGLDQAAASAIQANGRIVVVGKSHNGNNFDFAVARYMSDGVLDDSFGTGGIVTTAIGSGDDVANAVAIQPDGAIVVAGSSYNGSNHDFAVVRYNSNGSLDTTFNVLGSEPGIATVAVGAGNDVANALVIQQTGEIALAGTTKNGSYTDIAVVRLLANGQLDTGFSADGKDTFSHGTYDAAYAIAEQIVGGVSYLVVAGEVPYAYAFRMVAIRYNSSNGSRDMGFGTRLLAVGVSSSAKALAVQAGGELVLAGDTWAAVSSPTGRNFVVARLNANGTTDTSFGTQGVVVTPVALGAGNDYARAVAIDASYRIVVSGYANNASSGDDVALVRYTSDGALDVSFDGDGKVITPLSTTADRANAVTIDSEGRIVVTGYANIDDTADDVVNPTDHFAVLRYFSETANTAP